jgi:hypothetical protein
MRLYLSTIMSFFISASTLVDRHRNDNERSTSPREYSSSCRLYTPSPYGEGRVQLELRSARGVRL